MNPIKKNVTLVITALTLILLATPIAFAGQAAEGKHGHGHADDDDHGGGSAFSTILDHYEGIRQALLADEMTGVADHAQAIRDTAQGLGPDFSAQQAGVRADQAAAARDLLPAISDSATELAAAGDLVAAREALYALSKTLVRYRKLATGDLPAVAYCPMAKKSWLQPQGKIGNPYYGQEMPGCGDIVTPGDAR